MSARKTPSADMSVGAFASRAGLPVSTIHYYDQLGLISSWRNAGNHRRYDRAMLRRVAIIKVAQKLGLGLSEIQDALDRLPKDKTPNAKDWARMSASWADQLTRRIEQLTTLRDQMDHCIGCGCLSVKNCPLYNPDDELGQQGPGARRLDPG